MSLLQDLKQWREKAAAKEGVELFRVLPNAAIDEIVRTRPGTKDELMSIKGIKDAKYRKYGVDILRLVSQYRSGGNSVAGASSMDESRWTSHEVRKTDVASSAIASTAPAGRGNPGLNESRDTSYELRDEDADSLLSFRAQPDTLTRVMRAGSPRVEESQAKQRRSLVRQLADRDDKEEVATDSEDPASLILHPASEPEPLSISQFLDGVNLELSGMAARVRGEVSSVDERERVTYFSLKDATDGSTLPCLIFRSAYAMSGVRLAIGDEVIVEGAPEIWKPMGKLSFKCSVVEYAGEGALKKAYDALLAKLTVEGLLAPERKREIPAFPHRIALLTSRDGAAIGDFMMNVGRHGYVIDLYASSVEGARAVPELLAGVRMFNRHADRYDVLVIIRGGGSLESLQAFNNEMLVREIANSKIPVIAGIGHEKDITLATLVADAGVSTPTAASRLVRQSWEDGAERVLRAEHVLRSRTGDLVAGLREALGRMDAALLEHFQTMKERIRTIVERFLAKREALAYGFRHGYESIDVLGNGLRKGKATMLAAAAETVARIEILLKQFDPNRALNLGYSLVRLGNGAILRKSKDARIGDMIDVRLSEGGIEAEITSIAD